MLPTSPLISPRAQIYKDRAHKLLLDRDQVKDANRDLNAAIQEIAGTRALSDLDNHEFMAILEQFHRTAAKPVKAQLDQAGFKSVSRYSLYDKARAGEKVLALLELFGEGNAANYKYETRAASLDLAVTLPNLQVVIDDKVKSGARKNLIPAADYKLTPEDYREILEEFHGMCGREVREALNRAGLSAVHKWSLYSNERAKFKVLALQKEFWPHTVSRGYQGHFTREQGAVNQLIWQKGLPGELIEDVIIGGFLPELAVSKQSIDQLITQSPEKLKAFFLNQRVSDAMKMAVLSRFLDMGGAFYKSAENEEEEAARGVVRSMADHIFCHKGNATLKRQILLHASHAITLAKWGRPVVLHDLNLSDLTFSWELFEYGEVSFAASNLTNAKLINGLFWRRSNARLNITDAICIGTTFKNWPVMGRITGEQCENANFEFCHFENTTLSGTFKGTTFTHLKGAIIESGTNLEDAIVPERYTFEEFTNGIVSCGAGVTFPRRFGHRSVDISLVTE